MWALHNWQATVKLWCSKRWDLTCFHGMGLLQALALLWE